MKKLCLAILTLCTVMSASAAPASILAQNTTELTLLDEIEIVNPDTGKPQPTRAIAFSPDGAQIAVGSWYDGDVYIIEDRKVTRLFRGADSEIFALAFTPDNTALLVGAEHSLQVWDLATATRKRQFSTGIIWSMSLSADGELVACGLWYGQVVVRDLQTGNLVLEGQQDDVVTGLVFDQARKRLMSSSWDGTVVVHDLTSGEQVQRLGPYHRHEEPANLTASLEGLALSEDEQQLYLVADDGFRIVDLETGAVLTYWTAELGRVFSHALTADRRLWAVTTDSLPLQIYDMTTGELVSMASTDYPMFGVALHPAETLLGTTDPVQGTVRLWAVGRPPTTRP